MDRHTAERLVQLLTSLGAPLNEAVDLLEGIPDAEERRTLRKGVGLVIGQIYTELFVPIVKQYPDLHKELTGESGE